MPDDHNRSTDARISPGNWGCTQGSMGGRIRRMATAAMAMALLQKIPVAAKATGDVEVPILSEQILARSRMHGVWMDLQPSRPRTYWTNRCSTGYRSSDRSPGQRDGGPESQAAENGWCGIGLGLGSLLSWRCS